MSVRIGTVPFTARVSLALRSTISEIENRLGEGSWSLLGRVVPDAIE